MEIQNQEGKIMKIENVSNQKIYKIENNYKEFLNIIYYSSIRFSLQLPIFLTPENLKNNPIKLIFYRLKNLEIIFEIEVSSINQVLDLFLTINKFNFSKRFVILILDILLNHFENQLENCKILKYNENDIRFLNLVENKNSTI